jgi:hypothetical protein
LHTMSQVTYCAARLQQEPESTIVPITARFLMRTLTDMRQWSREGKSWEQCRQRAQTITWVRIIADDVIVSSKEDMTDVTAEAWRIAAIIYYQCRLLRLPRNHPDVLANMDDLAKCIRIMPTSGSHFTAQAPLLPVFFLGLLATNPAHKEVSRGWFQQVTNTPVRSVSKTNKTKKKRNPPIFVIYGKGQAGSALGQVYCKNYSSVELVC